ncbi:phage tail protein [Clostridium senegalense]
MSEQFYTILTKVGKAKIANATALGTKVNFCKFQVGDSNGAYYNPTEEQTELKHKVWEGNINNIRIDDKNPNWVIIEVILPSEIGGFTIREAAMLDDEDNVIAVAKYPETYKPQTKDGSSKDILIRTILEVSNANSVTLKVDPTVILATKKDIEVLEQKIKNFKVPVTSVNTKFGDIMLKAEDIDCEDGKSVETHLDDITKKQEEVFQSVSNGKGKVAGAITDKGVNTLATDTFDVMATNIRNIKTGYSSGDKIPGDKVTIEYGYEYKNSYSKDKQLSFKYAPGKIALYNDTDFFYGCIPYGSDYKLYRYNDSSGFSDSEIHYYFDLSTIFFSVEHQKVYYLGEKNNTSTSIKSFLLGSDYSYGSEEVEGDISTYYRYTYDKLNPKSIFCDKNYLYIPYTYIQIDKDNTSRKTYKRKIMVFNKNCSYIKTITLSSQDYNVTYMEYGNSYVNENIIYTIFRDSSTKACIYQTNTETGQTLSRKYFNNTSLFPENANISFIYFLNKDHVLIGTYSNGYNDELLYVNLINETSTTIFKNYRNGIRIYTDDNTIHILSSGYKSIYSIKYENNGYVFTLISKISILDLPSTNLLSLTKNTIIYKTSEKEMMYQFKDKEKVIKNITIK